MKKNYLMLFMLGALMSTNAFAADPTKGAEDPKIAAADVISLFSGVYTGVTVDTWKTSWSNATLEDVTIDGNDIKKYSALDFVGIEHVGVNSIDATNMNFIHVDVWTGDATTFRIKLVDFGADDAFGGGDDTEHEIAFENPAQNEWISYHIPMADFANLGARAHLSQMIFSALPTAGATVYIDNVYYTSKSNIAGPEVSATTPSAEANDVISMFSNAYTDVMINTWRTDWSAATLEDMKIGDDDVKKYSSLDFVGIEAVGDNSIDASSMEHFNIDFWSPNSTKFSIKIVDFGADNAFGGGDDTEHQLDFENPNQNEWVNYKIALTDFTGVTSWANISQIILVSQPTGGSIIYVDNVFFSKEPQANNVNELNSFTFKVYPNPAKGIINISSSNRSAIKQISLINLAGQTMLTSEGSSLNVSDLTGGVYFLKITSSNGVYTQKVLVD